jgi:Flp pilus assembly pilin Flp
VFTRRVPSDWRRRVGFGGFPVDPGSPTCPSTPARQDVAIQVYCLSGHRRYSGKLRASTSLSPAVPPSANRSGPGLSCLMRILGVSPRRLLRLGTETLGQDLVEYALMAGFVAVAAGAVFPTTVMPTVSGIFSKLSSYFAIAAAGG